MSSVGSFKVISWGRTVDSEVSDAKELKPFFLAPPDVGPISMKRGVMKEDQGFYDWVRDCAQLAPLSKQNADSMDIRYWSNLVYNVGVFRDISPIRASENSWTVGYGDMVLMSWSWWEILFLQFKTW